MKLETEICVLNGNMCPLVYLKEIKEITSELAKNGTLKHYFNNDGLPQLSRKILYLVKQKGGGIISFIIMEKSHMSLIATRFCFQKKGFAEMLINEVKTKNTEITCKVDALNLLGVEKLLNHCGFVKEAKGTNWSWTQS